MSLYCCMMAAASISVHFFMKYNNHEKMSKNICKHKFLLFTLNSAHSPVMKHAPFFENCSGPLAVNYFPKAFILRCLTAYTPGMLGIG